MWYNGLVAHDSYSGIDQVIDGVSVSLETKNYRAVTLGCVHKPFQANIHVYSLTASTFSQQFFKGIYVDPIVWASLLSHHLFH